MGNNNSINRANFERVKTIINNKDFIIINTLPVSKQDILIKGTLEINDEERLLNELIKKDKSRSILIYGENSCDETLVKKYNQLNKLGFTNLYVYIGGLFEWLLLNDIYGDEEFEIVNKQNDIIIDILKYKG